MNCFLRKRPTALAMLHFVQQPATSLYLFRKNKLENEWIAHPAIAQLSVLGLNIHPLFNSPFFKDHDMVAIENRITGDRIGVDPTVSDYLGIDQISISQ